MNSLDRRSFFQKTGVAGVSLLAFGLGRNRAMADPDPPQAAGAASAFAAPQVYSFPLGTMEAHVILDGIFTLPSIQPAFAPEATPEQVDELLKKNFLPSRAAMSLNVLVVKTPSGIVLFDSGAGAEFGGIAGRLVKGLASIGMAPGDVKNVFVTHAHMDHIGGLLTAAGELVFPSAKIIALKTEMDFWSADSPDLSGMRTPPEVRTQMAASIKKTIGKMQAMLELKVPGKLTAEIELLPAPGHTPGHAGYQITSGDEKIVVLGDSVHIAPLQFPHPDWTMIYDTDPALAAKTRHQLAAERTIAMGYHLPYPGLGHVRAEGKGYEWVPRPLVT